MVSGSSFTNVATEDTGKAGTRIKILKPAFLFFATPAG
jgi:hypothetical protein